MLIFCLPFGPLIPLLAFPLIAIAISSGAWPIVAPNLTLSIIVAILF
jgi:hypothetical protein